MTVHANELMSADLSFGSPAYVLRNAMIESGTDGAAWAELPDVDYIKAITASDWFQAVGLHIPDDASDEDILVAMKASRTLHQSDAWIRGDLINWVREHKYNSSDIPREDLLKLADEMGVASWKRLLNNATTCANWPMDYRHPSNELSYSHHEELNVVGDLAERSAWAERCIAEGISIRGLRQLLTEDAVSIDATITQTDCEMVVTFASDTFDRKTAIACVVNTLLARAGQFDAGDKTAMEFALAQLIDTGFVKLPPRKWVESGKMAKVVSTSTGEDDEE